jgi:Tol biopolymer transport system component
LKKEIENPFLEKIRMTATTNIYSKRVRSAVISYVPTRVAFLFAVSTILLLVLPGLSVIQINQSAWAGTFPGPNGQIAFISDRDAGPRAELQIFSMTDDGNDVTRLSEDEDEDLHPRWSPDGEKIAFSRGLEGQIEIFVMDADGSNPTRLTNNNADDTDPTWSPDGEKIAFASDRDDGNWDIYVMDADDGSDVIRLTDNDEIIDWEPTWSPDGEKIAFASDRDATVDVDEPGDITAIYTMDADDGSDVTRLSDSNEARHRDPNWSPDGEKIAFSSTGDANSGIYTMDADDGSDVTRLTDDGSDPSWSPDGEKIAFASDRDDPDNSDIYVMDADDGSDVTRLTDDDAVDSQPDWGINTSTPGDDDDDKNKQDDRKKKHHDDNSKKKH